MGGAFRMGSAARHRERAEEPPPDASAVIAGLGRVGDETDAIIGRMNRIDGGPQLIVEAISLAAHWAEAREQLEALAALLPSLAEVHRMGVADGRRQAEREAAEREAAERARPVRHRHRKPHLTMVTGTAAVASIAASVAGGAYVAQDSALVRHWSAASPAAVRLHEGPADSAVPVPVPSRSPSARPSVAVKAAAPAPSVTASPPPSSSPPPPAPSASQSPPPPVPDQAPSPSLLVSVRDLDLTGTSGTFTITALDGSVDWWVSTDIPGASVDMRQGVLSPGQDPVTITVTDPLGESGSVYIRWGDRDIATVWVTAGAPAAALP